MVNSGLFLPVWHNEHKPGRLLVLLGHQQTHLSLRWAWCFREGEHNGELVKTELSWAREKKARVFVRGAGIYGDERLTKCLQRLSVHFHKPATTAEMTLAEEGFVNIWEWEGPVAHQTHSGRVHGDSAGEKSGMCDPKNWSCRLFTLLVYSTVAYALCKDLFAGNKNCGYDKTVKSKHS